jgi:ribonuclease HI
MNPDQSPSSVTYKIYTDGGARGNPGPAAAGYIIFDAQNHVLHRDGIYLGSTTNNVAEYQAVIHALTWLKAHLNNQSPPSSPNLVNLYLDSTLIARQLEGAFRIKQPHLQTLAQQVSGLLTGSSLRVAYHIIPRAQNHLADSLVNQALDRHLGSKIRQS